MNEVTTKPEEFVIAIRGETANIKRHFKFVSGFIDLDINIKMPKSDDGMTLKQLHQASLNLAIQELQRLLASSLGQ